MALVRLILVFLVVLPTCAFGCGPHCDMPKHLNLFVVGTGIVGSKLLEQIEKNDPFYRENFGLHLKVVAIANSRSVIFRPVGLPLNKWQRLLEHSEEKMDWGRFQEKMLDTPNAVLVDCSSNQMIADSYASLLDSGISVVTPNKKANSSSMAVYKVLHAKGNFLYDANVGAGLPILSTIKSLVRQGDEIIKIEAVLSGTLSYLFNSFKGDVHFSELVRKAKALGYTEPDPRDDLTGLDVARKLLIIAREARLECELEDVQIKKFLPESCFTAPSIDAFFAELEKQDEVLSELLQKVEAESKRLVFIATLENGSLKLALEAVGPGHPFSRLSGCDNAISITTRHYLATPLVIQGPGAGADVTAAKVLGNIVQLVVGE